MNWFLVVLFAAVSVNAKQGNGNGKDPSPAQPRQESRPGSPQRGSRPASPQPNQGLSRPATGGPHGSTQPGIASAPRRPQREFRSNTPSGAGQERRRTFHYTGEAPISLTNPGRNLIVQGIRTRPARGEIAQPSDPNLAQTLRDLSADGRGLVVQSARPPPPVALQQQQEVRSARIRARHGVQLRSHPIDVSGASTPRSHPVALFGASTPERPPTSMNPERGGNRPGFVPNRFGQPRNRPPQPGFAPGQPMNTVPPGYRPPRPGYAPIRPLNPILLGHRPLRSEYAGYQMFPRPIGPPPPQHPINWNDDRNLRVLAERERQVHGPTDNIVLAATNAARNDRSWSPWVNHPLARVPIAQRVAMQQNTQRRYLEEDSSQSLGGFSDVGSPGTRGSSPSAPSRSERRS